MFCSKCQNDLADCTCEDIKERLGEILRKIILSTPSPAPGPMEQLLHKVLVYMMPNELTCG